MAEVSSSAGGAGVVPGLMPFQGELAANAGERVAVNFAVYARANGGAALWTESQNVSVGKDGKYAVLLGAGSSSGLPQGVFAAGEARWLGIRVGDGEEMRVELGSVPYAMKAADAESLAGRAASEFVTQEQLTAGLSGLVAGTGPTAVRPETTTPATVTGSGAAKYLPIWTGASTLGNSVLYQGGTATAPTLGINTTTPSSTLDVNGQMTVRNEVILTGGAATSTAAVNSPSLEWVSSAYNSSTAAAVPQKFVWRVTAAGNNTAAPTGSLDLQSASGNVTPVSTGLLISPKGIITFASGQTFPGASSTTPAVVNATSYDLNGTRFDYGNQSNQFLAYAGNGNQGTGTSNIAVGNSSLDALTSGSSNSSVGFATLTNTTTGSSNTAVGAVALEFNTTGSNNVGVGGAALVRNSTGNYNTAVGEAALANNSTGLYNTAVGYNAGPDSSSSALAGSTAIGYGAVVSQSNSVVLGQTTAGSPGAIYARVGVGTATPVSALELSNNVEDGMGPVLTLTNGGGTSGAPGYHPSTTAIDFKTYLHSSTANSPTSRIEAVDADYGNSLSFFTKAYGSDTAKLIDWFDIGINYAANVNGFLNVGDSFSISSDPPTIAEFGGSIEVDGSVNGSAMVSKLDHPLDPANKYLQQSTVNSSELMNLYSGNVTTDKMGLATVTLPEWFEAENTDFRYQLTTIGRDAHAWVAEEVKNHTFKIATNATFVKVSWQITAVRQDAYAKANPLVVEKMKPAGEKGFYLHPDLYGQSPEKQVRWGRHPEELVRAKARHAREGTGVGVAAAK